MPFVQVTPHYKMHCPDPEQCSISCAGTEEHGYFIYIKLGRDLVMNTWKEFLTEGAKSALYGLRLAVHEGTETDAGFIMLVPSPTGYKFGTSVTSSKAGPERDKSFAPFVCKMQPNKFRYYQPRTVPCPLTLVDVTVDGSSMLVQMPEWFVYTKPVSVPKTFEQVAPTRGVIIVTTKDSRNRHQRRHS